MIDARTLLAVCIADEAANQPHEGKVAVGRVVMNRTRLKYESDGTVEGTVLRHMQFSGFWCDFEDGRYAVVAHTPSEAMARARAKLARYSSAPKLWRDCLLAADQAMGAAPFAGGPEYAKITPLTVSYYAPSAVPIPPVWATPDKLDAVIAAHHFFHA
jgi:hypothetical protein